MNEIRVLLEATWQGQALNHRLRIGAQVSAVSVTARQGQVCAWAASGGGILEGTLAPLVP